MFDLRGRFVDDKDVLDYYILLIAIDCFKACSTAILTKLEWLLSEAWLFKASISADENPTDLS